MAKRRAPVTQPTNLFEYYQTTHDIFKRQWNALTPSIPHQGERGRNDEERVKHLLAKVLPKRFALGTGFVASPTPPYDLSPQTDILVYDALANAPLFDELSSLVLPAEAVYAAIEVKTYLDAKDLKSALDNLGRTRKLSHTRYFTIYHSENGKVSPAFVKEDLAPRTYLVGYDARLKKVEKLAEKLSELVSASDCFRHGVFVIDQGWCLWQRHDSVEFQYETNNSLFWFIQRMRWAIEPFIARPAFIMPYTPDEELRRKFEVIAAALSADVPPAAVDPDKKSA